MTDVDVEGQAGGGYTDEDIADRGPMGRFATPDDAARAVAFLTDPEQSSFVNGQTLSVDGGWYGDGGWESLRRSKQDFQDLVPTSGAESGSSLLTRRARGSP